MQYTIVFGTVGTVGTVVKVVAKMVVETVVEQSYTLWRARETVLSLIYFSKQRLVSDSN